MSQQSEKEFCIEDAIVVDLNFGKLVIKEEPVGSDSIPPINKSFLKPLEL